MDTAVVATQRRATVVTAYYPIRSKFPAETYAKWITEFWPHTTGPLVFFTDPRLVGWLEAALRGRAGPTKVVGLPFESLAAFQKWPRGTWTAAHAIDPERAIHSPDLYAIWYEKKEFVARVIAENPFGTETFVWCDAGICRYPEWLPALRDRFALEDAVPRGRILVLQVQAFRSQDSLPSADGIRGEFTGRNSVGGGILASDVKGWSAWSAAYDAMMQRYLAAGRFVGKDQNIMASAILEKPELAELVHIPSTMSSVQAWFYLLFYLTGVRVA